MPYIKQERRRIIGTILEFSGIDDWSGPGELNFAFTILAKDYLGDNPNYQRLNDVLGALEAAKLELYRRIVIPYEDGKIKENGDVY